MKRTGNLAGGIYFLDGAKGVGVRERERERGNVSGLRGWQSSCRNGARALSKVRADAASLSRSRSLTAGSSATWHRLPII